MDMKMGLIQEQSLKLSMTQELKQAITLLQYSTVELASYIQELAMENPLIEIKETNHTNILTKKSTRKPMHQSKESLIENVSSRNGSLREYLRSQLVDTPLTREEKKCLHFLIDALDTNGYLKDDLEELAKSLQFSIEFAEEQLSMLQDLEPAGVGARSLQECILLQLQRCPNRHLTAEAIIANHFRIFAEKSWKDLSKKTKLTLIEIQEIHDIVKQLEPRPGLQYQEEEASYIVPDLIVREVNNSLGIYFNDEISPRINVNKQYEPLVNVPNDKELKSYISSKLQQGRWLEKSLEQRKDTMLRVMKEITIRQEDYFYNGEGFLKPLTLKDIADELEIHESTVSRTVKDKYVQTPHGLVEMKSFFSTRLDQQGNADDLSSSTVKTTIETLVQKENKAHPLSDQKIANVLKTDYGINVSRRTVAKYRDQLTIPSSALRKRY
ncbi:RNA polymerase factor sigma-54 [Metabacillus herbersteinensis]|uniref:RNA polymerase factor sigma-54 n=1 Tax=Metabacillus herbersteinensis TaxID=283816 RepID=A0ABV6GP45_9BACI